MKTSSDRSEVLRAMAHPVRLRILAELVKGIKCVRDLEEFLEISQPNVSQHLGALRKQGIIDYYMDGRLRCYFLRNSEVQKILEVIGGEYAGDLPSPPCCPVTKRGKYPGDRKH